MPIPLRTDFDAALEAIRQLLRLPLDEAANYGVKPGPTSVSTHLGQGVAKKHHMPAYPRAILIGLDVLSNAVLAGRPY
jgi:hypothetical protein